MTQAVLSFVTLYGLSFSVWGVLGLCRLLDEKTRHVRRHPVVAGLAMASGVTGSVMLALPLLETLPDLASPSYDHYAPAQRVMAAGICGLLASFTAARLFRTSALLGLVVTLCYGVALGLWDHFVSADAQSFPGLNLLSLAIVGVALFAGWLGLVVARVAAPGEQQGARTRPSCAVELNTVAVLIPAHNEEASIGACLSAITKLLPSGNIYVASDGSTDNTAAVVRQWGCHVVEITPGRGKARALDELLNRFDICRRYKAVMILDADSEVDPHYFERALPLFDDASIAAVAGHAFPAWEPHWRPRWHMFFIAYRVRLYKVTQAFLRYGQTWRHSNVSFIIPGFASMYRTEVLPKIAITAPGLIIEDFNMTFEVHHKKLGKIAYTPAVRCMCQDPTTFRDYVNQVKRWDLGLWQTVRRHGVWPSLFWLSLATFLIEISLQSAMFLTVPLVLSWLVLAPGETLSWWSPLGMIELRLVDVLVGVLLADYFLTVAVALLEHKPMLLIYGIGFLIPRFIDAFLFLATLPLTFLVKSDGRWTSPQRSPALGDHLKRARDR